MNFLPDISIKLAYQSLHDKGITSKGLTLGNIIDCTDPGRTYIGRLISRVITWLKGRGWIGTDKALEILNNHGKAPCIRAAKQQLKKLGNFEGLTSKGKKTLAKVKLLTAKILGMKKQPASQVCIFAEIEEIQEIIKKSENSTKSEIEINKTQTAQASAGLPKTSEIEDLEVLHSTPSISEETLQKPKLKNSEEDATMSKNETSWLKNFDEVSKTQIEAYRCNLKNLDNLEFSYTAAMVEFDEIQRISKKELTPEKGYHKLLSPETKNQNRYQNILPYKHNAFGGENPEEYVNASLIKVGGNEYLASQGPLKNTMDNFLKMAINAGSNTIVTLVMHQELKQGGMVDKCLPYWHPELLPWKLPDGSLFKLVSEEPMEKDKKTLDEQMIWKREFVIEKEGQPPKYLTQFHYYNWPDFGEPDETIFDILLKTVDIHKPNGPIVVHCSAGVGRTGTFIASHSKRTELKKKIDHGHPIDNLEVNIVETVLEMRTQRAEMVQSSAQVSAIKNSLIRFYEVNCK